MDCHEKSIPDDHKSDQATLDVNIIYGLDNHA